MVFAVSGLWHGAALTFLVWGLLNGGYQVTGALTAPARMRLRQAVGLREDGRLTALLQMGCTFLLSTLAWVFFQASSLSLAGQVFARMVQGPLWVYASAGVDRWDFLAAAGALALLLAVDWAEQTQPLSQRWLKARGPVRWASALALLLATAVFGCYGPGYDAQSFIYFQF